jgi:hypothetical protein
VKDGTILIDFIHFQIDIIKLVLVQQFLTFASPQQQEQLLQRVPRAQVVMLLHLLSELLSSQQQQNIGIGQGQGVMGMGHQPGMNVLFDQQQQQNVGGTGIGQGQGGMGMGQTQPGKNVLSGQQYQMGGAGKAASSSVGSVQQGVTVTAFREKVKE